MVSSVVLILKASRGLVRGAECERWNRQGRLVPGKDQWRDSFLQKSSVRIPDVADDRALLSKEVFDQTGALLGEKALGMELHAFERPRRVANAHQLVPVGPGRHLEFLGKGLAIDT